MTSFAIVTGGNRGLGLEICKKLIQLNKPVVLTARNTESGKAVAESLGSSLCHFYQLDISDSVSINNFVQALSKDLPGQQVDLLINNAGVLVLEWTKENFDKTIQTNLSGPVLLTRALEPHFNNGALIINVSSFGGQHCRIKDEGYLQTIRNTASVHDLCAGLTFKEDSPQKSLPASCYSLSKAALSKATILMSEEPALKERHISLVSVCPGWCRTDMGNLAASVHSIPPRSSKDGADSILRPFTHPSGAPSGAYLDEHGTPFQHCI